MPNLELALRDEILQRWEDQIDWTTLAQEWRFTRLERGPGTVHIQLDSEWTLTPHPEVPRRFLLKDSDGGRRAIIYEEEGGERQLELCRRFDFLLVRDPANQQGRWVWTCLALDYSHDPPRQIGSSNSIWEPTRRELEDDDKVAAFGRAKVAITDEAVAWLDTNRPRWRHPLTSWD